MHTGTLKFNTFQIELTTRCPLRCSMCIKDTYMDWHRADMSFDNFVKILPYIKHVRNIVLEGWGESLLHPDIIDIIKLIKKQGSEVGFVTSGFGLDETNADKLIKAGIDFIGFSFSGGTRETHNSIRIYSDFNDLSDSIKIITRRNLKKPKIHIVYLVLKKNIHEMPTIIKLASELKINEIVFINIIHITNNWQDKEKAFICNEDDEKEKLYRKILNNALKATIKNAKRYKIKISLPSFFISDVAVCSENPLENLYISVEGEVSPCVYLHPPLKDGFKRVFCGQEFITNKLSFGNIFREDIETIWNKKEYMEFRNKFYHRKKKFQDLYSLLLERKKPDDLLYPEPPEPCKTCHKILGL